jgi:hypothetical protein
MRRWWPAAVSLVLLGTCTKVRPAEDPPSRGASAAHGDAAADDDLRVLLSELASASACSMLRDRFLGLHASERPDTVIGVLWIRDCAITSDETRVAIHLGGTGWRRASSAAGHIQFGMTASLAGALDLAYDRRSHIVTLRFPPDVDLALDGDVDRAAVITAVLSALTDSPGDAARSDGITGTIELCTGVTRFARAGASTPQPVTAEPTRIELAAGGLAMFGPQPAARGMTVRVDAQHGAVRIGLVCADEARALAESYLAGKLRAVPTLASADVHAAGRIRIPPARCPVVMIAQSLEAEGEAPATFTWQRSDREPASSSEGALIRCK